MSDENFDRIYVHAVSVRTPRKSARAVNFVSDSTDRSILRRLQIEGNWADKYSINTHTHRSHIHTHQRSTTIYGILGETLKVCVACKVSLFIRKKVVKIGCL